jgi:hypothetical protein
MDELMWILVLFCFIFSEFYFYAFIDFPSDISNDANKKEENLM